MWGFRVGLSVGVVVAALGVAGAAHAHAPAGGAAQGVATSAQESRAIASLQAGRRAGTPASHIDSPRVLDSPAARRAFAQYQSAIRAPFDGPRVDHLADTWCGDTRSTDNTANATHGGAPHIKVVYAYPADKQNRFNQSFANLIQTKVKQVSQLVSDASGGRKTLRWDQGTNCGPQYVDIQVVKLPQPLAYYQRQGGNFFLDVETDVHRAPGLVRFNGTKRHYAIYVDQSGMGGGVASIAEYEGADGGPHQGRETDAFLLSWGNYNEAQKRYEDDSFHNIVLLHEIMHGLGAVQPNAPKSSGAGHCWDQWDIMCYDDGGPAIPAGGTQLLCPDPPDPSRRFFDCNGDTYFNPDPAPGSYLATKWNVYNSVFLCELRSCTGVRPNRPPSVVLAPAQKTVTVGTDVVFSSAGTSDPDSGDVVTLDWDLDGNGSYEIAGGASRSRSFAEPGTYTVGLRGTDRAGATATASARITVNREVTRRVTLDGTPFLQWAGDTTRSGLQVQAQSAAAGSVAFEVTVDANAAAWMGLPVRPGARAVIGSVRTDVGAWSSVRVPINDAAKTYLRRNIAVLQINASPATGGASASRYAITLPWF